ncbi:MAG: beta-galactosidase, partial [Armatimonadota bacterium]
KAARTFVRFLRGGGDFISVGGYAFDNLLPGEPPDWEPPPPPPPEPQESSWIQDIRIHNERARTYAFSGWLRTEGVSQDGFAYLAVYQYDEDGRLGPWRDVLKLRGSNPWRKVEYSFTCEPEIRRISIKVGLYRCRGVAWIDDLSVSDDEGSELLHNGGFEEDFDWDARRAGKWYRTQAELGEIVPTQPHSGRRCAKVKLRYHAWPKETVLNTARGRPRDGLEVRPDQVGVFDAGFRLERVAYVRAAPGQDIVPDDFRLDAQVEGWAAVTVLGYDDARRVPLMAAYDRYGRPRGSVGSLTYNYSGRWRGSAWAIFGADNVNLFPEGEEAAAKVFVRTVDAMQRETFLHNLEPGYWCYRQGEQVELSVKCSNFSRRSHEGVVRFAVYRAPVGKRAEKGEEGWLFPEIALDQDCRGASRPRPVFEEAVNVSVEGGQTTQVEVKWKPRRCDSDFYVVEAALVLDGTPVDRLRSGFVVWSLEAVRAGPRLNYRDNYCYYGNRPLVLLGSDSYSFAFNSSHENPLVWRRDLARMRDQALNFNENLQFNPRSFSPPYEWPEEVLRKVDAMIQLSGQYRQTYYAGLLIGANAMTSDEELANQKRWCRAFAERYKDVPHLMYYIDGDFRLNIIDHPDVKRRFNEFLARKYETDEALRRSWRVSPPPAPLGEVQCVHYVGKSWDDMRAVDTMTFASGELRRWVRALVAAIKEADPDAIISSEFYSVPFGGIDIIKGIDDMDTGNIGFFTTRGHEGRDLPVRLKFTDMRERGKSLSVGELGAKTHPAWKDVEGNYHEMRSREQLHDLFMTVCHYAFGLGASRIHNWCWKDNVERIFPWGLSYPC